MKERDRILHNVVALWPLHPDEQVRPDAELEIRKQEVLVLEEFLGLVADGRAGGDHPGVIMARLESELEKTKGELEKVLAATRDDRVWLHLSHSLFLLQLRLNVAQLLRRRFLILGVDVKTEIEDLQEQLKAAELGRRAQHNEALVRIKKIGELRKRMGIQQVLDAQDHAHRILQMKELIDESRFKSGKCNFSELGRRIGRGHETAKKYVEYLGLGDYAVSVVSESATIVQDDSLDDLRMTANKLGRKDQ